MNNLITPQELKDNSFILGNTSDDKCEKAINKAQVKYIREILGDPLYFYLVDNYIGYTGSPDDYTVLIKDYIIPALCEYTMFEGVIYFNFQFTNKGTGKRNDQYQDNSELKEMIWFRNELKNNAEWFGNRLRKYLKNNTDKYPQYEQPSDDIEPAKTTFSAGISMSKPNDVMAQMYHKIRG